MKCIKYEIPLLFINTVHLSNNSSENPVRNLEEKDFCYLIQKYIPHVLDLCKKEGFLSLII